MRDIMSDELWIGLGVMLVTTVSIMTQILPWFRAPKFAIRYSDMLNRESPVPLPDVLHDKTRQVYGYWLRVKVRNRGQKTAQNVEGKLTEIRNADGTLRPQTRPVPLAWGQAETIPTLCPGETDILDVVKVVDTPADLILVCTCDPTLPESDWKLHRGTYYLVVEVYADDAKPAKAYYRLDWQQDGSKNIHMKTFRWWERLLLILRLRIINHSNAA
jgi:hypothetical protein